MNSRTRSLRIAIAVFALAALLVVPAALAAKGGNGGGGKGKPGGGASAMTGSLSLVLVNSTDGVPHYGQQVKFNVATNAPWPFVDLDCFQGGASVYHSTVGYYGGWPWGDTFTLSGWSWTGGEADCTATLYNSDGGTKTTITTLGFHVYA